MARFLITSALPYANGPIHFGHIVGAYLPADIYTRHRRLQGHEVVHISGSDEHGVAIMLNAQKAKMAYQDYVNRWHESHRETFKTYGIDFDFFGQTSSDYHRREAISWFEDLNAKGLIEKQQEQQLQCQDCHNYLPDRFVEGTCYVCGYQKARGDECPNCGTWIEPIKLIDPECKFCGSHNIKTVDVNQWYLKMSRFHSEYRQWFCSKKNWKKTVTSYVDSLTKESLHDRAITRDLDWGIDVPLEEAKGKKLYVWFDAPIGYVSNLKEYLRVRQSQEHYLKDWWANPEVNITNFIGKDNIIFHAIVFPIMSMASSRARPVDDLPANQYLNLMGRQFSKSQGWYVDAHEAVETFGQDALRYYLTTLIPEYSDSSFTWEGLEAKVNSELANNIGNFINRCLKFFHKNWPSGLDFEFVEPFFHGDEVNKLKDSVLQVNQLLDQYEFRKALDKVMHIGFEANTFFSDQAPWAQYKKDPDLAAKTIAAACIYTMVLGVILKPFLPNLAEKILHHFSDFMTEDIQSKVYTGKIELLMQAFKPKLILTAQPQALVQKIDKKIIEQRIIEFQAKLSQEI